METLTKQEIFLKNFKPEHYYDVYYAGGKGASITEWIPFTLKNLHELFSSGEVCGDTMMDMGAGPSIYQLLSACEVFKNIITSDLLEENCAQIKKWLRKDSDMLDWSSCVQTVCDLEGNREKCEEKEEKLRRAVKCVLKCDFLQKNPFEPLVLPPADCLLSCLCLESACKDLDTYCYALKNFRDLLKPGGHIVTLGALHCTFYCVRDTRFSALSLTKEDIVRAFTEVGYEILKLEIKPRQVPSYGRLSDLQGFYFVHAIKRGNL